MQKEQCVSVAIVSRKSALFTIANKHYQMFENRVERLSRGNKLREISIRVRFAAFGLAHSPDH
jgi:hypothetical protein